MCCTITAQLEINEIVKRRTAFETSLIRKGSNERDWLQYIEYEKRLEQLRKIRASKLSAFKARQRKTYRDDADTLLAELKGRPTISDYSIARHILSLYSSAVTRIPGSVTLWQVYITHVLRVSNSSAEISRVLARAISLHPTNASVWLLAIRFEADGTGPQAKEGGIGGGNIDAARKLAMRALRFMKGASDQEGQKIWLEWVSLEVSFVERMRKRWEILGIANVMAGKANMDVDGAENGGDSQTERLPEAQADVAEVDATEQEVAAARKKGQSAVLDGAIVKAVIENACSGEQSASRFCSWPMRSDRTYCAAYSESVSMHQQLLSAIRPLPTPLRAELLSHIYANLELRIPTLADPLTRAQAHSLLCRRDLADLAVPASDGLSLKDVPIDSVEWIEAVGQTVSAYKAAITEEEASLELQEEYAADLADFFKKTEDASLKQYLRMHLLKLVRGMQRQGTLTEIIAECARRCEEKDRISSEASD